MTPTNLEECFEFLKEFLSFEDQAYLIKTDEPLQMHHTLGQWMRNNWGLWRQDSELYSYFKNLGLWHADDMSSVILTSFARHLRSEPLDIEGQVQKYLDYWKRQYGPQASIT